MPGRAQPVSREGKRALRKPRLTAGNLRTNRQPAVTTPAIPPIPPKTTTPFKKLASSRRQSGAMLKTGTPPELTGRT